MWMTADYYFGWHQTRLILWHLSVYIATVLTLGSVLLNEMDKPRLRYTLPASNFLLVAGPMACGMLTMFVQYAIVAMILNRLFDVEWPILGPGLLAAVLIAWCHAVFWSTSNSLAMRLMAWLASLVTLALAHADWAPGPAMSDFLPSVSGSEFCSFGLAAIVCLGVGTAGFAACDMASESTCRESSSS